MSEISGLWTTGGATGDQQASYTQADDATIKKILAACSAFEGVAPGFLNELECTENGANTVAVDTGGAVVDGKYYLNDASDDINIPSASGGGNTRIDRIVLRADWAGFDVSIHRIAGTDAATPSAPAITQTSETTYDIKLCQVLVTTGGVVTVTDERVWARQYNQIGFKVFYSDEEIESGDGKLSWPILDKYLDGAKLSAVMDALNTPSTSGLPTVQIARGRRASPTSAPSYVDMLSTRLTIDENEYTSLDATTPAVINSSNAIVRLGDELRIDVDVAGTDAMGLNILLTFEGA